MKSNLPKKIVVYTAVSDTLLMHDYATNKVTAK